MSGERKTNPSDPTAERTSAQSTQTASGLTGGREVGRDADVTREPKDGSSKRAGVDDPALPADDATLKTTI